MNGCRQSQFQQSPTKEEAKTLLYLAKPYACTYPYLTRVVKGKGMGATVKYKSVKSVKGLLTNDESLIPVTFIDKLEDILHGFLGIVLFIISVLAAGYTLQRLIETRPFFPLGMIQAINDTLFVVIILEIMRTVIVRFTDGIFQLDNFLIIGVIAAVRHILTVGASLTMEKEKTTEYFNRALIEMGVNTGIVLALVFALFLSRAARKNNSNK
jgi:uncharacterized membrane protein (DUF373 family)